MQAKQSEAELVQFAKRYKIDSHKYQDKRRCPRCFQLLWKSDKMPDYEIVYQGWKSLVEVKQGSPKGLRWAFANADQGIRDTQHETLTYWMENHNVPYLWIALGDGRVPDGRGTFLLPYPTWMDIEAKLLDMGQKSITYNTGRMIPAVDIMADFELIWLDGAWLLPDDHVFHQFFTQGNKIESYPTVVKEIEEIANEPVTAMG
jgi:hypothetical protein